MDRRPQLHEVLKGILGSNNVYFQPPENVRMEYPAIIYKRNNAKTEFGDDIPYTVTRRYLVTLITQHPDSDIWEQLVSLKRCLHERWFAANDLNHDVFNLYF